MVVLCMPENQAEESKVRKQNDFNIFETLDEVIVATSHTLVLLLLIENIRQVRRMSYLEPCKAFNNVRSNKN